MSESSILLGGETFPNNAKDKRKKWSQAWWHTPVTWAEVDRSEVQGQPYHKKKKKGKIPFTPCPSSSQIGILSGRMGRAMHNMSFFAVLYIRTTIKQELNQILKYKA